MLKYVHILIPSGHLCYQGSRLCVFVNALWTEFLDTFLEFWSFGRIVPVKSMYISLDISRRMSHRKSEPDIILNACCTIEAGVRVHNDFGCQVEAQD